MIKVTKIIKKKLPESFYYWKVV